MWKNDELNAQDKLMDGLYLEAQRLLKNAYLKASKKLINEMLVLYNEITNGKVVLISDLYRFNRFYELQKSIIEELNKLGIESNIIIEDKLFQMYFKNSMLIGKTYGFITEVSTEMAKKVIDHIWCNDGLLWKDRTWVNNLDLLKQELVDGLIDITAVGGSTEDLKVSLMNNFDVSYNKANRLVKTELKHVEIQSALDQYINGGCKYYEYLTSEDNKVCDEPEYCKVLDRQIFSVNDTQHLPPQHPNCRCSILPVLDY